MELGAPRLIFNRKRRLAVGAFAELDEIGDAGEAETPARQRHGVDPATLLAVRAPCSSTRVMHDAAFGGETIFLPQPLDMDQRGLTQTIDRVLKGGERDGVSISSIAASARVTPAPGSHACRRLSRLISLVIAETARRRQIIELLRQRSRRRHRHCARTTMRSNKSCAGARPSALSCLKAMSLRTAISPRAAERSCSNVFFSASHRKATSASENPVFSASLPTQNHARDRGHRARYICGPSCGFRCAHRRRAFLPLFFLRLVGRGHSGDRYFQRDDRLDGMREGQLHRASHLSAIDARAHHGSKFAHVEEIGAHEISELVQLGVILWAELAIAFGDFGIVGPHGLIGFAMLLIEDRALLDIDRISGRVAFGDLRVIQSCASGIHR